MARLSHGGGRWRFLREKDIQEVEVMGELKALIFDVDGVMADTEKDGHRVAFNTVFKEEELGVEWDVQRYGELLKIAGGKERLRALVYSDEFRKDVADKDEYILKIHKRKTEVYKEIVEQGKLPARSGVKRLITEAHNRSIKLGVASTSHEESVRTLIRKTFGGDILDMFNLILAGDIVKQKKPSPEIYQLSSERLNVPPENCAVVEDSRNGLLSAKGAGMACVVTPSFYTNDENFDEADLVVTCLGDPGSEVARVIKSKVGLKGTKYVTVDVLSKLFG
jgi:HAD superfamily hydrolase (TIGR01509 family)